jgi:hypothetical protein
VKFRRENLDKIFYIHGNYRDPQKIVLDTTDYYQVRASDKVQNMLKAFLDDKTILFVKYETGLEDPNFDGLLKWAAERQKNIPNKYCLLVRDGDNLRYNPLITLRYGRSHEDLVPYLNTLLADPANALTADTLAKKETSAKTVSGM